MPKLLIEYPPGATPLDPNEIDGLIPGYISTQAELNLLEQENILEAQSWAQRTKPKSILTEEFTRKLHQKMFKNVWKWAGQYRKTEKNIGVTWLKIPEETHKLCTDATYWIENKTYPWDELAARFHHRLVWIHLFSNGNGRHARLMTDLLLESYNQNAFTWGGLKRAANLSTADDVREEYITALRDADQKNFEKLIRFGKS